MSNQIYIPQGEVLGHPKGLFLLFATEMWERFSYYGMRALLVLSLMAATTGAAGTHGFGWTNAEALRIYGTYTSAVYFTPFIGGWLADNFLGQRKAVIIGAFVMAAGQFALAVGIGKDINIFYAGLVLMVIGNGFFKANISTMVGDLYKPGDSRRDSAFSIFYMGVNLGAFLSPLICGYLGEKIGWKYGYAAAGVGMLLSAIIQITQSEKFLGDVGKNPSTKVAVAKAGGEVQPLTRVDYERMAVVALMFVFVMLFWLAFEQAGGLMNIYAKEKTDRIIAAFEVPASWFQAVNALFIILLAPVFGMMWVSFARKKIVLSTPIKMVLGLLLTAVGFMFMMGAVYDQQAHGKANMLWLIMAYLFHTMGELCISPVGLSMVTKLAPVRFASIMMGLWFLINAAANKLASVVGGLAESYGELQVFGGLVTVLIVFALALWAASGMLQRMMHGAEDIKSEEELLEDERSMNSAQSPA